MNKTTKEKKIKKTLLVKVESTKTPGMLVASKEIIYKHKKYKKILSKTKKIYVDIELKNDVKSGDFVYVVESQPISKLKRWSFKSKKESK